MHKNCPWGHSECPWDIRVSLWQLVWHDSIWVAVSCVGSPTWHNTCHQLWRSECCGDHSYSHSTIHVAFKTRFRTKCHNQGHNNSILIPSCLCMIWVPDVLIQWDSLSNSPVKSESNSYGYLLVLIPLWGLGWMFVNFICNLDNVKLLEGVHEMLGACSPHIHTIKVQH